MHGLLFFKKKLGTGGLERGLALAAHGHDHLDVEREFGAQQREAPIWGDADGATGGASLARW